MISRVMIWTAETTECRKKHSAFVLLELVVVLAIIAIIASATMMSLRVPLQNARMERVLSSLEDADRRARLESQRRGEVVELTIDARQRRATQRVAGRTQVETKRSLPFTGEMGIDRHLVSGRTGSGRVAIRFAGGKSESYALRLTTNGDDPKGRHEWLVVVGATGQYIRTKEDAAVEEILQR